MKHQNEDVDCNSFLVGINEIEWNGKEIKIHKTSVQWSCACGIHTHISHNIEEQQIEHALNGDRCCFFPFFVYLKGQWN